MLSNRCLFPLLQPGPSPSPVPSPELSPPPVLSPSPAPNLSPSPAPELSPSPTPTGSPSPGPSVSPSPAPAGSPSPSPEPLPYSPSPTPGTSPSPTPGVSPSPEPEPIPPGLTCNATAGQLAAFTSQVRTDSHMVVQYGGDVLGYFRHVMSGCNPASQLCTDSSFDHPPGVFEVRRHGGCVATMIHARQQHCSGGLLSVVSITCVGWILCWC
jgi:hypothetical protein